MSEFEDRQDAAPAVDPPATQPVTPARHGGDSSADDHEALAAVEGADAANEETAETTLGGGVVDAEVSVIDAEQVRPTAVLVLEDEPVELTTPAEPHSVPMIDWVASVTEIEPEATDATPTPDWAASVPATELSELPVGDEDEAPLLDDALEHGIASVFAALHSAAQRGDIGESDEPIGPLSETDAIDGITFRLLGELDRLWHRAA